MFDGKVLSLGPLRVFRGPSDAMVATLNSRDHAGGVSPEYVHARQGRDAPTSPRPYAQPPTTNRSLSLHDGGDLFQQGSRVVQHEQVPRAGKLDQLGTRLLYV